MIFTKQERNIILFVVLALLAGFVWLLVKKLILQQPVDDDLLRRTETVLEKEAEAMDSEMNIAEAVSVHINTATVGEIAALPYIGEAKAKAIVKYRKENGPFKSVDDLVLVSGIGEKLLDKVRKYIEL